MKRNGTFANNIVNWNHRAGRGIGKTDEGVNMKYNISKYVSIEPRIVQAGKKQIIRVKYKYDFREFNGKYCVTILPKYVFEYDSEKKGAFFETLEAEADEHGVISFAYCFGPEQEYVIKVEPVSKEEHPGVYVEASVYALGKDLYGKHVLKGDLHLHTTFSDGVESPEHRAIEARKQGYDFLAVTDHNNYSGSISLISKMAHYPNNMVFIRGEEVHAKGCPVHILSLGASYAIAPLVKEIGPEQETLLEEIKEKYDSKIKAEVNMDAFAAAMDVFNKIHAAGGTSVLCHMYWDAINYRTNSRRGVPEPLVDALVEHCKFDVFEITSGSPGEDYKVNYLQEIYYREKLPQSFPVIGVTDSHSTIEEVSSFGKNYTIVFTEEDSDDTSILNAIKNGWSVSVEKMDGNPICRGSLRLAKYATFLNAFYFPVHDEIVKAESLLMERVLLGAEENKELLKKVCADSIRLLEDEWGTITKKFRII